MITAAKDPAVINLCRNQDLAARPDIETQLGMGIIVPGYDKKYCPLTVAKNPFECLLVNPAWLR